MVALFALAILSLLATRALENHQTLAWREREAELLQVGTAYSAAIKMYYEQAPGTQKSYPRDLESLLLDARAVRIRRPLRRLYRDPMTANAKWGLVRASDGGIMGVYSLSERVPIKSGAFPASLGDFAGAGSYRDWKFMYVPPGPAIGSHTIGEGK